MRKSLKVGQMLAVRYPPSTNQTQLASCRAVGKSFAALVLMTSTVGRTSGDLAVTSLVPIQEIGGYGTRPRPADCLSLV
jgi:hypothetical protein